MSDSSHNPSSDGPPSNPFFDAEVVSSYSRAQAIEDGVLVDLTANFPELCANAGFKYPVAITCEAFARYIELTPAAARAGNDIVGRAWDVLWMLRYAISQGGHTDTLLVRFHCVTDRETARPCVLKALCGPDDGLSPCITLMLPEQD
jgi:hypothetical protein